MAQFEPKYLALSAVSSAVNPRFIAARKLLLASNIAVRYLRQFPISP